MGRCLNDRRLIISKQIVAVLNYVWLRRFKLKKKKKKNRNKKL